MRIYCLLALCCFSSLLVFSQQLELEKASPFTAVRWEADQPVVQFEDAWYQFSALDHFSKKEILDFCKQQFGRKWQKRFSEDLVEVLDGMGYQPTVSVKLQLSKEGVSKMYTGTFTKVNRQRVLAYNQAISATNSKSSFPQTISKAKALADIKQFEEILNTTSSYVQLTTYDYNAAIDKLATSLSGKKSDVDVNELTHELSKIMSEIGDRHSSIKNEAFDRRVHKTYNLNLPFGVAVLDGKLVALIQHENDATFGYYLKSHPFLKSIDGIAIETLVNSYNYRDMKAPAQAKLSRGSSAIQNYGALLFKNNSQSPESVTVVFSDGTTEKKEIVPLTTERKGYSSKLLEASERNETAVENGSFEGLSKRLENNIGYITIPVMYHYDEVAGLEDYMEATLQRFSDTKALIIDVRNNPGGGREIIKTVARYIVQPEQTPWVANVAYLRTDETMLGDTASMSSRYLYSYNSKEFTAADRKAIDQFHKNFKLQKSFDTSKFSSPFYMVLHNGTKPYAQPVFILANEQSFSAATVFTSAFKGLPNVNIVGVTTDGSSGNSIVMRLKNSNIRVKVSTMLSFQRNGLPLDGNGTIPDIVIPADKTQVLEGEDSQLQTLIDMIQGRKH